MTIIGKVDAPVNKGLLGLVTPLPAYSDILVDSLNIVRRAHNVIVQIKNTSYRTPIRIREGQAIGSFEGIPEEIGITELNLHSPYFDPHHSKQADTLTACRTDQELADMFPNISNPERMEGSTQGSHRISSLGVAGGVVEIRDGLLDKCREAGNTFSTGDEITSTWVPSPDTQKGGLPWGMVDPGWTKEERKMVVDMLSKVPYAFQKHELDHSFVKGHHVGIDTGDAEPIVMPSYRMDQIKLGAGSKLIKQFLIMKIIEPSKSAWRSPLLLIRKPDGTFRMTTDLRGLNSVTKKDQFPLPRIDEMLDSMKGAQYMAKLDLRNAFFQILLKPEDKEKTAFVFDKALYHYRVLPQGLVHSPANLCRIMHELLHEYDKFCFPYMDDVAIIAKDFKTLIQRCGKVFETLGKANALNRRWCSIALTRRNAQWSGVPPTIMVSTVTGRPILRPLPGCPEGRAMHQPAIPLPVSQARLARVAKARMTTPVVTHRPELGMAGVTLASLCQGLQPMMRCLFCWAPSSPITMR